MPIRLILNGINSSSTLMVASNVKTTWMEDKTMSLKLMVDMIMKTDKFQDNQRTTIHSNSGKLCMLMKQNLYQHQVSQRSSDSGSIDHSIFSHSYHKEDISRDWATIWQSSRLQMEEMNRHGSLTGEQEQSRINRSRTTVLMLELLGCTSTVHQAKSTRFSLMKLTEIIWETTMIRES
jgi:hypothetical protein